MDDEVSWPIHSTMSYTIVVFVSLFVCLATLLGPVESGEKFLLKKNSDGTFLLVPAPANASVESTVDLKNLPPIAVAGSSSREAPGVNSQSPPLPASSVNPSPAPALASSQVCQKFCMLERNNAHWLNVYLSSPIILGNMRKKLDRKNTCKQNLFQSFHMKVIFK